MPTSARREPTNSPQISVKTVRTARADVHPQGVGRIRSAPLSLTAALAIGPYRPVSNIGTNSYRESYSFAPDRALSKNRARERAI